MATVNAFTNASAAEVFAVLANGWCYSGWVVGTSHMQAVEAGWPNVGSRLFHATGLWPAVFADVTVVDEMVANERLVMTARGGPLGEARIEISLVPEGLGTRVAMTETPISGPGRWVHNKLADIVLHRRNVESLARLKAMAEQRNAPGGPNGEQDR